MSYLFGFGAPPSFRRPRARAEELFDGRIDVLPGGESLSEWCDEPLLVATSSVLTELIDCGHVCVQPGDGGAEAEEAHQIS